MTEQTPATIQGSGGVFQGSPCSLHVEQYLYLPMPMLNMDHLDVMPLTELVLQQTT